MLGSLNSQGNVPVGTGKENLLARLGAFSAKDVRGKTSQLLHLLPFVEVVQPIPESDAPHVNILPSTPIADLVALEFALHDLANLVDVNEFRNALPHLEFPEATQGRLINLRARPLSLASAFPSDDIKGDFGRTLQLATIFPWDRACMWFGSKKDENHGGQDLLRLHRIVSGDGSVLEEDQIHNLPPHLRRQFVLDGELISHAAILPDPRNDRSLLLSQFHARILAYHNRFVTNLERDSVSLVSRKKAYDAARNHTTLAFHSALMGDVVPRLVDREILRWSLANQAPLYRKVARAQGCQHAVATEALALLSLLTTQCQPVEIIPNTRRKREGSQLSHRQFTAAADRMTLPRELFQSPRVPTQLDTRNLIDWSLFLGRSAQTLEKTGRFLNSLTSSPDANAHRPATSGLAIKPETLRTYLRNEFDLKLDVPPARRLKEVMGSSAKAIPIETYFRVEATELTDGEHLAPLASLILVEAILGVTGQGIFGLLEQMPTSLSDILISRDHTTEPI